MSNTNTPRDFLLSIKDVETIAASIIDGHQTIDRDRSTILKGMVALTIKELGAAQRKNNAKAPQLDDQKRTAQLAAFEAVYAPIYEAVVRVAENTVPDPDEKELRSRTAFCRSAGSTVRSFIRAGNDITAVAAAKATKASLAVPRTRRKFTVEALRKRAERLTAELHAVLRNLQAANSEIAAPATASALASVVSVTDILGKASKDQTAAVVNGAPFQTRTDVFVPVNLAAVRAAKKAA